MSSIGKSIYRVDGVEKVTGTALYVYDMELPGMLYAKLVRSTEQHARIIRIDVSKALSIPGVVAVVTGKDLAGYRVGIYVSDRPLLAEDKVRFYGEPVAAVIAENEEAAERAAELVEVEYDPLPAIFDVEEAIKPTAPLIHDLGKYNYYKGYINPVPGTNIANKFILRRGDVNSAFLRDSVKVVEAQFTEDMMNHVYMEPISVIARWLPNNIVEIWTSAQSPFAVRYLTAKALHLPESNIVVHVPYVGGGFGGKAGVNFEPLVAMLSKVVQGRPVKLSFTREENFFVAPSKVGVKAWAKLGVNEDGKILAFQAKYLVDSGGYADYAVNVGRTMGYIGASVYYVPNILVESYTVYTNKPYATAFRGFGILEAHWVIERIIDIAAQKLGIDPLTFRLKNIVRPGLTLSTGQPVTKDSGDLERCLKLAAELIDLNKVDKPKDPYIFRGKGIAASIKGPSVPPNNAAQAFVRLNEDGTIDVSVGTTEIGQGTLTGLAQLVAEEFGVPIEKIKINIIKDTSTSAYTWQTVGSRSLYYDGNALLAAIRDVKAQIRSIASKIFNVEAEEIEIKDGKVFPKTEPNEYVTLSEIAMGYTLPNGNVIGGPILGRGYFVKSDLTYLDENGQGIPFPFFTFGAHAVEIEVDVLTGKIKVLKYVGVFDVGKVVNPKLLEGQIIGGAIMGISYALYERLKFDNGVLVNPNLIDYKVIRSDEIPQDIISIALENPEPSGPYGVRGIGENTMLGVAAAIGNAVYNAIKVNLYELPMTPERVWRAIREQRPELLEG
ncbi:xanthine dehydrogenase family protein molybdopterin-binding subunit [Vulcanisaeta thermophila]|uniref:xanthine dehydrogenase family protein molybdopterin-binding subunit n=1 Tax=Vulcanisaeta thermophila TaxID=867917 RepID=UPI000853B5A4|nr:xanthine dehydrogenase family protein molybdopterin-binding subunit [Vulcanisaeta thermophila]